MPPGGLALADEEAAPVAQTGGLQLADTGLVDTNEVAIRLRMRGNNTGQPNAADNFAAEVNPSWAQIQKEMRPLIENQSAAGADTERRLMAPPIDRRIPYFKAAAGMLRPTQTGSFGESLGYGLSGYTSGLEDINKAELEGHRLGATQHYNTAKDKADATEKMLGLGIRSGQVQASLALLEDKLYNGAHEKFAKQFGARPGTPDWDRLVRVSQFLSGLPQDQRAEVEAQFVSNPKASAQDLQRAREGAVIEKQVRAEKTAKRNPYITDAQFDDEVQQEVRRRLAGSRGATSQQGGAGAAPAAPQPSPQVSPPVAPQSADGAPRAIPASLSVDQPSEPVAAKQQWGDFLKPTIQFPGPNSTPGQIKTFEEGESEGAKDAREWYRKTVSPEAQEAVKQRAEIALQRQMLREDPGMTGAGKETLAKIGNILDTLHMAPSGWQDRVKNVQQFTAFMNNSVLLKQIAQNGVQTEGDARRMLSTAASMPNSAAANDFLLRWADALANRVQMRDQFFRDYQRANGHRMAEAQQQWLAWSTSHPLHRDVLGKDGKKHPVFEPEFPKLDEAIRRERERLRQKQPVGS